MVGESWGSALGIFWVEKYPEKYYSFVGTGQIVDFSKTEELDYENAIKIAHQMGIHHIMERTLPGKVQNI